MAGGTLPLYIPTAPFSVDSESGEVIVTETLDYEAETLFSFNVNDSDNGDVPRTNFTTVGN